MPCKTSDYAVQRILLNNIHITYIYSVLLGWFCFRTRIFLTMINCDSTKYQSCLLYKSKQNYENVEFIKIMMNKLCAKYYIRQLNMRKGKTRWILTKNDVDLLGLNDVEFGLDSVFLLVVWQYVYRYFTGKWSRYTHYMLIYMDDARSHDIYWIINFSGPQSVL